MNKSRGIHTAPTVLSGCWKVPFGDHRAVKLTLYCVCFAIPYVNLFLPSYVTREYHPRYFVAYLERALAWFSWSHVAKHLQVYIEDLFGECKRHQIVRKKAKGSYWGFQPWHPCRLGGDYLSFSYRLWRGAATPFEFAGEQKLGLQCFAREGNRTGILQLCF